MRGAAGGRFVSLVSESDGGNRSKGVDLGASRVVEVGSLIAASFCCGAEMLGVFSSKVGNGLALLSWAFGSIPADSNNGEVPNEKTGEADEAAG